MSEPAPRSTYLNRLGENWLLLVVTLGVSLFFFYSLLNLYRVLASKQPVEVQLRAALLEDYGAHDPATTDAAAEKLNIYLWDGYLVPNLLETYALISGVDVQTHFFSSNDEMEAELLKPRAEWAAPYDLILPAQYQIARLSQAGVVMDLDGVSIPRRGTIASYILDDPNLDLVNEFGIPYFSGSIGLAYQRDEREPLPIEWSVLFEHSVREAVPRTRRFRTIIMQDMRFSLGSALIYLGQSPSTDDAAQVAQAADLLIQLITNRRAFLESENTPEYLAHRMVDLAMAYSADPLRALDFNRGVGFANPLPGTIVWYDCLAIVKGSPHPDAAAAFIDFLLDPRVAGFISSTSRYASTLSRIETDVIQFIDEEVRNGFAYTFPDASNQFLLQALDPAVRAIYDREWARVLAAAEAYAEKPILPTGPPPTLQ